MGAKREVAELRERLAEAHRRVESLERELRASRTKDTLTGLMLHEALMRRLASEIDRSRRHSRPLAVAIVDVDGMRAINAHHGRAVGDLVLKAVAKALTDSMRANDAVARSGADEFTVMLPETDLAGAAQAVERILLELEVLRIEGVESVSVSAGVAEWERALDGEQLLDRAFEQLLSARLRGGGRVGRGEAAPSAERKGWDPPSVGLLRLAAMLHDVGNVSIPDGILGKPAPLTGREMEEVRRHSEVGAQLIARVDGLDSVVPWIRYVHERFDGGGYPDGLAGEAIPEASRILLVADAFVAMTSGRPYRQALPADAAIAELRRAAGTQFDRRCVESLVRALESAALTSA